MNLNRIIDNNGRFRVVINRLKNIELFINYQVVYLNTLI